MIVESEVEGAEFLKKRRHLTDDDFRSPGSPGMSTNPAPRGARVASVDLEERQRLREENPEDIRAAQKVRQKSSGHHGRAGVQRGQPAQREPEEEKSMFVFFNRKEEPIATDQHRSKEKLLPAASVVRILLARDVVIRAGRTNVIAIVGKDQRLPPGTKLVGQASAGRDGVVSIRFNTLVLPSGESVSVRAEALDSATGSGGLAGSVEGGVVAPEHSVARSVGSDTASRFASGALGGGILGGAVGQTFSESERAAGSSRTSAMVVTLSRETRLEALFLQEVSNVRY